MNPHKNYYSIKILVLGLCLVPFLCGISFADKDNALLKAMIGEVGYMPDEATEWETAFEGLQLFNGDKIKTGADGMATIAFTNGSQVMLKPNSEFEIESLDISEKSVDYKLKLHTGKLRALVEKIASNSSFTIKTPTAVAAIRGTLYYLNVREAGEDEVPADVKERLVTDLFVEVGGVLYTNLGSGKYFMVNTSMSSSSYEDGTVTVPIEVPEDRRPEWTSGWELLVPEAYQSTDGTDLSGLFADGTGGDSDPRLGDKVNEVLAAAIALYDERNAIWQEMCDKLLGRHSQGVEKTQGLAEDAVRAELERNFLRASVCKILNGNRERRLEGYIEKISDAQTAKVLTDIYGNRVRMEQYILRPATNVVEVLNVNLRANNDLTTMAWATTFNQSLDTIPTGGLRALPWNDYLTTRYSNGKYYINPAQVNGIYPAEMSIMFSHAVDSFVDSFTEARKFDYENPDQRGRLTIYDQTLLVKNFNSDIPMPYAFKGDGQQPEGTYSVTNTIVENNPNPQGFSYNFAADGADISGNYGSINSAFYVMSDTENSVRQDGYDNLAINNIWDALRVNMPAEGHSIGNNNLEMVFSSSVFQNGVIDLIYVPTSNMIWQEDDYLPDYSLGE